MIRVLAPETGKTITNTLPLLEIDLVRDITMSTHINKMFLLLENGDIWIYDTTTNPCSLLDTWKVKEDCSLISLCETNVSATQNLCLLFGATTNGQILLFGHRGNVRYHNQIHPSAITNLAIDGNLGLIVTGGLDKTIRVSSISHNEKEIVRCVACINTKTYVPKLISFIGVNIATCSEEGVVHMFKLLESSRSAGAKSRVLKYRYEEVPDHLRSDDHVEAVTCISPISKLDLVESFFYI